MKYSANFFYKFLYKQVTLIEALSISWGLMIDGQELIIQDTAEGHYPQMVINPQDMACTEAVITIIMKMKNNYCNKKKVCGHLMGFSFSVSNHLTPYMSPNQVLESFLSTPHSL